MLNFIYNPTAGKGKAQRFRVSIEEKLKALGVAYCFWETSGCHAAQQIVKKLTEKGQTAARSVDARARQAVEQAGEGLENGQREIFYRVLGQIAENLHGICRTGIQDG